MIVALCGGIGSGKSAVAEILRGLGAHTLSADSINAELLKDPAYLVKLRKLFPEAFVAGDEPDKKKIREIIFSDEERRKKLNGLAHGEIMAEIARRAAGRELVFVEIPLLAEAGAKNIADKICFVRAPREARARAARGARKKDNGARRRKPHRSGSGARRSARRRSVGVRRRLYIG